MLTYSASVPMRDNSTVDKQIGCDAGAPTITVACDWLLSKHCCPLKRGFSFHSMHQKRCRSGMTCFNHPQGIDVASIGLIPDQ